MKPALTLLVVAALLLTACGGAPTPSPVGAWPRGTIQQPQAVTAQPSSSTAYCAPCHPSVITVMRDVAATRDGFVAIGSRTPDTAVVWSSADGQSWSIQDGFPDPAGKKLTGVATRGSTIVVVGRGPKGPAAWVSTIPGRWQAAAIPAMEGAMTTVTATADGFLAAGYRGPEFGAADAALWRSSDGARWQPISDGPPLADGRVGAVAQARTGLVAVGTTGDTSAGRAAAWVSRDGLQWTRAPAQPSLEDGAMLSVTATAGGLAAVGRIASGDRAAAWTSTDGLAWTRAPDAASFASSSTYAPHAEMSDVLATDDSLVAVGWNSSASNGSAVVWTSTDGLAWTRATAESGFSGGGMNGVALGRRVIVAVGSTGWPDTHAATAWHHALARAG